MKTRRAKITKDRVYKEIQAELERKRTSLFQVVSGSAEDMRAITEERESELEETAQKDLITRLTGYLEARDQKTIGEINVALERIAAGDYGICENCENEIAIKRLRALPTTRLCIECAAAREKQEHSMAGQDAVEMSERLRADGGDRLDPDETQT